MQFEIECTDFFTFLYVSARLLPTAFRFAVKPRTIDFVINTNGKKKSVAKWRCYFIPVFRYKKAR
jgi:hypothetical protein